MQSSIVRDGPGTRVNAQNVPIRERKGEKKKGRENKRENAAPSNNGTFSVPPCGKNTLVMATKCSKFTNAQRALRCLRFDRKSSKLEEIREVPPLLKNKTRLEGVVRRQGDEWRNLELDREGAYRGGVTKLGKRATKVLEGKFNRPNLRVHRFPRSASEFNQRRQDYIT